VLHRQQILPVGGDQVVDPADVRGDDLPGGAHLAAQQLAAPLLLDVLGAQRLEGDLDAQLQIGGVPDLPHPAPAEERLDLVAVREDLAGGKGG